MIVAYLKSGPMKAVAALSLGLALPCAPASAESILFVGNSFTYGEPAGGPPVVQNYRPNTVTDLVGTGIGGVPALFKAFTLQAGLNYNVSLETQGGTGVDYHYNNRLGLINQPWDNVVLQSYSTLDANRPGNPATLIQYSALLANAFTAQNPNVNILLDATWSRADQTYLPSGAWYGQDISAMQRDVEAGYRAADANSPLIDGVIPVGAAWDRAIRTGFADPNPYDGIMNGLVNLWAPDNYHASPYGYYLEALMFFGSITGLDPLSLGGGEYVARDLGFTMGQALSLQNIAHDQLAVAVPEPTSLALFGIGVLGMGLVRRRRMGAGLPA